MFCRTFFSYLPGVIYAAGVGGAACVIEHIEAKLLGGRWLESIVLAILIGVAVNTLWPLSRGMQIGVKFSSKTLLEVAVVLLGASISVGAIADAGPALIVGTAIIVPASIAVSFLIGRGLGLSPKLATLIACGNSICGNSAIVAIAPVLDAKSEDIAASLAFTAVLGVIAVFTLPLAYHYGGISMGQYGIVAGMSVYAVPQVLAATAPVGTTSVQIGTIVKLIRVMMLGPVVFVIGQLTLATASANLSRKHAAFVPWFIVGFFLTMALRSLGLIPDAIQPAITLTTNGLAVVSMAALGLLVNVRDVASAGGRVVITATLSVFMLVIMGFALAAIIEYH